MSSKNVERLETVHAYPQINTVHDALGKVIKGTGFKPKSPRPDNSAIGIEIEVENVHTRDGVLALEYDKKEFAGQHLYLWNNVEDGSLRNNGREFVSIPVKQTEIEFAIATLFGSFSSRKETRNFEFTERTGIHIHVNAQDMSLDNLKAFLLAYLLAEPVLYNFCGGKRHLNIFCVPLNQTDSNVVQLVLGSTKLVKLIQLVRNWKKYNGLNLKPLGTHGTIEFRHMIGTADQDKLNRWIDLILYLKKFSTNNSYQDMVTKFVTLNSTSEYTQVLQEIFGEDISDLFFSNITRRMEESVIFIKEALSPNSEGTLINHIGELNNEYDKTTFFSVAEKKGLLKKPSKKKEVKMPSPAVYNGADWRPVLQRAMELQAVQRARGELEHAIVAPHPWFVDEVFQNNNQIDDVDF